MIWRVGNGTEPQDLDPQVVTGVPEHKLIMAIFEGLLAENPRDLSPEPGIAERWETAEALAAHGQSAHMAAFNKAMGGVKREGAELWLNSAEIVRRIM